MLILFKIYFRKIQGRCTVLILVFNSKKNQTLNIRVGVVRKSK